MSRTCTRSCSRNKLADLLTENTFADTAFINSGTEAAELAIKMVRNTGIIGRSPTAMRS